MNILFLIFISLSMPLSGRHTPAGDTEDPLRAIRAFTRVDERLASSGFVLDEQFESIRDAGFTHVISLLPGDQSHEEELVGSLGMTFTSIKVDWGRPTIKNLEAFVEDMEEHSGEKVYVHCQANMRASTFVFLYRVTRLGVDKREAKVLLDSIWYPTGTWHHFIEDGLKSYSMDPEYRFEPDFIKLVREKGAEQAYRELLESGSGRMDAVSGAAGGGNTVPGLHDEDPGFREIDLRRLGDEYAREGEMDRAIEVYELNVSIFPGSWEAQNRLAETYLKQEREEEAKGAYLKVIGIDPENIWARRMLGKIGVDGYSVYWNGTGIEPDAAGACAGEYNTGDAVLEFYLKGSKFYVRPSWNKQSYELFADSAKRFFVHHTNWIFEFPESEPGLVRFILPGRVYKGKLIN